MTSPQHLANSLLDARNDEDIQHILRDQEQCLQIYHTTKSNLHAFNEFSKARYQDVHKRFESHTKLLKEMKGDLDSIFNKLRKMKAQLAQKYPEEMKASLEKYPPPTIPDDEDEISDIKI
ncbi:KxDL motif-containing protein 1 [Apophysomyces ossiformis]|uniref:KxDL motif-containing protein 1 n=1 Tax=Apophysomyces ossiformis TaxID=679940 RepID=A0A8H7BYJ1_9FUNG|nr:KxDL motif-containing protein 1 [Apophysomyces ossiformis]